MRIETNKNLKIYDEVSKWSLPPEYNRGYDNHRVGLIFKKEIHIDRIPEYFIMDHKIRSLDGYLVNECPSSYLANILNVPLYYFRVLSKQEDYWLSLLTFVVEADNIEDIEKTLYKLLNRIDRIGVYGDYPFRYKIVGIGKTATGSRNRNPDYVIYNLLVKFYRNKENKGRVPQDLQDLFSTTTTGLIITPEVEKQFFSSSKDKDKDKQIIEEYIEHTYDVSEKLKFKRSYSNKQNLKLFADEAMFKGISMWHLYFNIIHDWYSFLKVPWETSQTSIQISNMFFLNDCNRIRYNFQKKLNPLLKPVFKIVEAIKTDAFIPHVFVRNLNSLKTKRQVEYNNVNIKNRYVT